MQFYNHYLPVAGGSQETVYFRGISCSEEENASTREDDRKSFGLNFMLYDVVYCLMCKDSNLDGEKLAVQIKLQSYKYRTLSVTEI